MRLRRAESGRVLTIGPGDQLGAGGEALVYATSERSASGGPLVAKVYRRPAPGRARKLEAMLAHPPRDPAGAPSSADAASAHVSIAWPVDLLRTDDAAGEVVGFLMPRVSGMRPVFDFYNPGSRLAGSPLFHWRYLHRTARNLAATFAALHARGDVIGDVSETNILVAGSALVTLVDTDSFQIADPRTGAVHRCRVGRAEFTPPELQGAAFPDTDRVPAHDHFGLAVLVHLLLLEGTHPFAGVHRGPGEPPSIGERIAAGAFPHARRRGSVEPSPTAPPFSLLDPALQALFLRCFDEGHADPSRRPDASTWRAALEAAEAALVVCPRNAQHLHAPHLRACPWCERTRLLGGRDPFPSVEATRRGVHLPPSRSRPAPRVIPQPSSSQPTVGPAPARAPAGSRPRRGRLRPGPLVAVVALAAAALLWRSRDRLAWIPDAWNGGHDDAPAAWIRPTRRALPPMEARARRELRNSPIYPSRHCLKPLDRQALAGLRRLLCRGRPEPCRYRIAEARWDDLDGDGCAEALVPDDGGCAARSGCGYAVVTGEGGPPGSGPQLVALLTGGDYRLLPTSSHGFRDLATVTRDGCASRTEATYRFDGSTYRRREERTTECRGGGCLGDPGCAAVRTRCRYDATGTCRLVAGAND